MFHRYRRMTYVISNHTSTTFMAPSNINFSSLKASSISVAEFRTFNVAPQQSIHLDENSRTNDFISACLKYGLLSQSMQCYHFLNVSSARFVIFETRGGPNFWTAFVIMCRAAWFGARKKDTRVCTRQIRRSNYTRY